MRSINVYVVHAKALQHRKTLMERLQTLLQDTDAIKLKSFTFVEEYDPGTPLPNVPVDGQPLPQDSVHNAYNAFFRQLKVAHVTNALKHKTAIDRIATCTPRPDEYHLILEDDALYRDTVIEDLTTALAKFEGGFMLLGTPSGSGAINTQPLKEVFKVMPCCDSYVIDVPTAKKISGAFFPIKFVTNIHLSYLLDLIDVKPLIAVPNVFVDGTKVGLFLSAIDSNSKMVFNEDYTNLSKAVEQGTATPEMFAAAQPQWHPELLHLKAQHQEKKGEYKAAKDTYEHALRMYDANAGIIDNQSELLRNFMRLYQHLQ